MLARVHALLRRLERKTKSQAKLKLSDVKIDLALNGKAFWEDFTAWPRCQVGIESNLKQPTFPTTANAQLVSSASSNSDQPNPNWPSRAAKILAEAKG